MIFSESLIIVQYHIIGLREISGETCWRTTCSHKLTRCIFIVSGETFSQWFGVIPVGSTFYRKIFQNINLESLYHGKFIALIKIPPFVGLIVLVSITRIRTEDRISIFILEANSGRCRHDTSEVIAFTGLWSRHVFPICTVIIEIGWTGKPICNFITGIQHKTIALIECLDRKSLLTVIT